MRQPHEQPPFALVFLRDTLRSTRSWRSMLTRAAWVGLPLATVVALSTTFGTLPVDQMGVAGRSLFDTLTALLLAMSLLAPPLMVSASLHRERQDGQIDLLALSGLSLRRVIDGTVHASISVLLLALLGTSPAVALILSLGGVGVLDVAVWVCILALAVVTTGWMTAATASVSKGVFAPAMATWLMLLPVPCLLSVVGGSTSALVNSADVWLALPLLLIPLSMILYARHVAPKFLTQEERGDRFDRDQLEYNAQVARRRMIVALPASTAVMLFVLVTLLITLFGDVRPVGWAMFLLIPMFLAALSTAAFGGMLELWAGILAARVKRAERDPSLQWRTGSIARFKRWARAEVRGPPQLWREAATQGSGNAQPWFALGGLLWSALLLILLIYYSDKHTTWGDVDELARALVFYLMAIAVLIAPVLAGLSWAPERRDRAIAMLIMAPTRVGWSVVFKAAGVWVRALPLLLAIGLFSLVVLVVSPSSHALRLLPSTAWLLFWVGVSNLVAIRVRPVSAAWAVGIVLAAVALMGLPLISELHSSLTAELFLPPLGLVEFDAAAAPSWFEWLWLLVAPAPWFVAFVRLERWLLDDR